MSTLTFAGVGVSFDTTVAVRSFSSELHAGEWLCLIGPNGAGKSSLLRACASLVRHSGHVLVDGAALRSYSSRRRAQLVAYVAQDPLLPADMTAFEYALLGRNPFVGYFGRESRHDRAIAGDVLERLDLAPMASRLLGTLSGGERQRIVIARALVQQAPVLLLDEPTSALDIGHQQQALELVDRLRVEHGLTVVSAMHDLTLAGLYADRLALLHQGVLVAEGPATDVLQAETLAEFYGASVRVHREPDGTVVIVPLRAAIADPAAPVRRSEVSSRSA